MNDSRSVPQWTRHVRPASASMHHFVAVPELFVTIRRLPEATIQNLPAFAADLIASVSRLEEAEGGRGLAFVVDGSREEGDKLVLRLLPKLADVGARERLARVAGVLNRLVREARENLVREQDTGYAKEQALLAQIEGVAVAATGG